MLEASANQQTSLHLSIHDVMAYVINNGWRQVAHANERLFVFEGPLDDYGNPIRLILPSSYSFEDASLRLNEAVALLSEVENRLPEDIVKDIQRGSIVIGTVNITQIISRSNNLANLQKAQNELVGAQANYEEALQTYRALAAENPRTYLPDVAMTLSNLANLLKTQNDFVGAQAIYEEALQISRALAAENPRTYLPYVATILEEFHRYKKED